MMVKFESLVGFPTSFVIYRGFDRLPWAVQGLVGLYARFWTVPTCRVSWGTNEPKAKLFHNIRII